MDPRSILLAMLPVGLTLINYAIVRDLLWGILLGNKSKKSAEKLKSEQSFLSKWTQSYIPPQLTKYQNDFKRWSIVRRLLFCLTVAQIIAFVVLILLKIPFWIVGIVVAVISVFNIVLFILMMNKTTTSDNKNDRKGSPWTFEQSRKPSAKHKK